MKRRRFKINGLKIKLIQRENNDIYIEAKKRGLKLNFTLEGLSLSNSNYSFQKSQRDWYEGIKIVLKECAQEGILCKVDKNGVLKEFKIED